MLEQLKQKIIQIPGKIKRFILDLPAFAKTLFSKPIYFLFVPFIPILDLYVINELEAKPSDVVAPLLISLFCLSLLFWGLRKIMGSHRAALFLTLFTLGFFYFGHLFDHYAPGLRGESLFGQNLVDPNDWLNLAIWLYVILFVVFWRLKVIDRAHKIIRILGNVLFGYLLLINIYNFSAAALSHGAAYDYEYSPGYELSARLGDYTGDVYYLVFDRYANQDTLERVYNYDNSEFLNSLEETGFITKDSAYSNYPFTSSSLASSLNMDYLYDIGGALEDKSSSQVPLFEMIARGTVREQFERLGYRTVNIGSWWPATRSNSRYDINYDKGVVLRVAGKDFVMPRFSQLLLQKTAAHPVLAEGITIAGRNAASLNDRRTHSTAFSYQARIFEEATQQEGKKFVFGHFLVPHPPYVFDSDGQRAPYAGTGDDVIPEEEKFVEQLKYTNKEIERFIDLILTNSGEDAIIIIQADEGPYPEGFVNLWSKYDFTEAPSEDIRTKLGILQTVYDGSGVLEESTLTQTTPVNIFRNIFNDLYGADYQILDDRHYIYRDILNRYDFHEANLGQD